MKQHRKKITSGDILEMMVQAGLKPASALEKDHEEEPEPQNPIISISGKDVQWHEFERRSKKRDRAA
jgi:hypothetical protein